MAQGRMPDLTPRLVDASKGTVEVRNIGDAQAPASRVFVVCTTLHSDDKGVPCAAGLHLAAYIEKWNVLAYDIPALRPGGSHLLRLFGPDGFPRRPGRYGMKITVDPLKRIAESDESNNYTRLDTLIEPDPGSLRLVVLDDRGNQLPPFYSFSYAIRRHGEKRRWKFAAQGQGQTSAQTVSLPSGRYDLHLNINRHFSNPMYHRVPDIQKVLSDRTLGPDLQRDILDIPVQPGQTVEERVVIGYLEPGRLELRVMADGKPVRAHIDIDLPGEAGLPGRVLRSYPALFDSPAELKLIPGCYKLKVAPEDEGRSFQNAGYGSKTVPLLIQPGETLKKQIDFTSARKGTLVLTVLVNGSRSKAEIGIRKAGGQGGFSALGSTYNFMTNSAGLLPGSYDLSIRPRKIYFSPGVPDFFQGRSQGPGFKTRRIGGLEPLILHGITIRSGERLEKTVEFTTK